MLELRGVIHGKVIELQDELGLPDGEQVAVTVRPILPPGKGLRRSAGAWADAGEEMDQWFEEIQRSRRQDRDIDNGTSTFL